GELLRDPAGLEAARAAHADGRVAMPLAVERLTRPVLSPGAIVCVGLNYRTHILEMGRELPTNPTLFSKLPRAMTDPYADIELPALVSDLSRIVVLEPGDVIATGTPGGVGVAQDRFLEPGDEVVVEIAGIGAIRNTFKAATA